MFGALIMALAVMAQSPAGIRLPPGTHFYHAPPIAVDHEAVVVSHMISGSDTSAGQNERRYMILRSGSWLREGGAVDGRTGFAYSDFAAGISIAYSRDVDGYQGLIIRRHSDTDNYSLYQRRPTGTRERVLGEDCEVWLTTRVGSSGGSGQLDLLSCDTSDGIQLWSRAVGSRGVIIAESRTISFRRRPVRPEEVRPPADLLRWDYWRSLPARESLPAWPARRPRNYELHLQGGADAYEGERERLLRSHGDWTYTDTVGHERDRRVRIDNRVILIDYQADADGRPVALVIQRLQAGWTGWRAYVAVDPPASESVIGEACTWSHQYDYRYCVTADGLPLRVREHHHGLIADLTATRVIRRQPPLSALMPPTEAFDWARWGVDPVD
jgi:hypothetical protein